MTATDELRRLLDERGVEYRAIGDATFWETHDGAFRYKAELHAEKLTVMTCCSQKCTVMTPAQAIVATLGRGECHYEWSLADNGWADHTCSACGYVENTDIHVGLGWNFCPNCGKRIEVTDG